MLVAEEKTFFAFKVARRSLEFFNSYFGKRYPLPKLDLVGLSRLSVGAMENWGLITCRETGLILEPTDSTPAQLQKVATLIAHEISHQVRSYLFCTSLAIGRCRAYAEGKYSRAAALN
jgi:puromycin-sensitive aminopeptidase